MTFRERNSLTALGRRAAGSALAGVVGLSLITGCTAEPVAPTYQQNADTIVAWLEERPSVLEVDLEPGFEGEGLVVVVDLQPDVDDDEIRAIGEYLETFDWSLNLDVDVTAGDDTWTYNPGLDPEGIVESVIWLRNDPRVVEVHVDLLSADGAVERGDVFSTAADFHAAMSEFTIFERLLIEQSEVGMGDFGVGTEVYVSVDKAFPVEAVEAAQDFLDVYPDGGVRVEQVEGDYVLNATARVPTSVDVVDGLAVVTRTLGAAIPLDEIQVTFGSVRGPVAAYTDARLPFIRAIADAVEVTNVGLGAAGMNIAVTGSAQSWAAANDIAVATAVEPVRTRWNVTEDVVISSDLLASADPYRTVLPALGALPSLESADLTAGRLSVTLAPDASDADLVAFVGALQAAGVRQTVELELNSHDDDNWGAWATASNGQLSVEDDLSDSPAVADLAERFAAAWEAAGS